MMVQRGITAAINARVPRTIVVFTFDDAFDEDLTNVKPILDAAGIKAGFVVPSGYPGVISGRLSWAEIKGLQDEGHEILGHTIDHYDLTTLSDPDITTQVNNASAYTAHGINIPRGFAYPGGASNANVRGILRNYYNYALSGASAGTSGSEQPLSTYCIQRWTISDATPTSIQHTRIDTAIANKTLLVFIVHSGSGETTVAGGGFDALADAIAYAQSHNVPIRTPSQAFDMVRNISDTGDYPGGTTYDVTDMTGQRYTAG